LRNLDKLKKDLESITNEISKLSEFRDIPSVRKFRRQLEGEKSVILQKIRNFTISKADKARLQLERRSLANKNRSMKMKRSWNFFRSIKENYRPDLSLKEIRSLFKKHRQGLETDIPDVAWRNPSP
jgi:hypothetical protein